MARNKTEPSQNALDIRSTLLGSAIQQKDPKLFQAVNQILEQLQKLQDRVTELEAEPGNAEFIAG